MRTTRSQSAAVCKTMTRPHMVLVLSLSAAMLTIQLPQTMLKLSVVFKHGTEGTISRQGVLGTYG